MLHHQFTIPFLGLVLPAICASLSRLVLRLEASPWRNAGGGTDPAPSVQNAVCSSLGMTTLVKKEKERIRMQFYTSYSTWEPIPLNAMGLISEYTGIGLCSNEDSDTCFHMCIYSALPNQGICAQTERIGLSCLWILSSVFIPTEKFSMHQMLLFNVNVARAQRT